MSVSQNVFLVKSLKFKKLMYLRIPSHIVGGLIGIFLAFKGYGVWSIVYQQLITQSINLMLLSIFSGMKFEFEIKLQKAYRLF